MDNHEDVLLTYKDLTAILQFTERHIRREVRAGRLDHLRIGHSVRFTREHVDNYIRLMTGRPATVTIPRARRRRNAA